MNKKLLITLIIIFVIIVSIGVYLNIKNNQKMDAEAVKLVEDLTIPFGKKVRVSDFIDNLNGELLDDYEIDTEQLGDIKVTVKFLNQKNKGRMYNFTITTKDIKAPKILIGDSYTIKVNSEKRLEDVLLSGDDIDDNPKREIIGEYDLNTIGDYSLNYTVTDASGNIAKKDFILHVVEDKEEEEKPEEGILIEDVISNYKKENTKIGIDVSKWQEEINWEEVKKSGVEFAIIRVGYQTEYDGELLLDPFFKQNIDGAVKNDLPVGIYFYSYAKNINQAEEQAKWVINQLKGYNITLPVAFDWENWNSFNKTGMSFYTINKVANVFLDKLEESGYNGMLYGSKSYLNDIWYPTKHSIWLAHYTKQTNYEGDYLLWQLCETGRVSGINKNVDIDVMY